MSLEREMELAGRAVRGIHLDRARSLGVSNEALATLGLRHWPFGIVKAEPDSKGFYQPGEGITHMVLPVLEGAALVDLVAFRSSQPDKWFLRRGDGWCLGLVEGLLTIGGTHLHSTPLDWMRDGGRGLCVLDWSSAELWQLGSLEEVTCSDYVTARLLRNALARPVRIPNIQIMGVAHAA